MNNDDIYFGEVAYIGYPYMVVIHDEDYDTWDYHYPATIEVLKFGNTTSTGWYKGLAPQYAPNEYDWFGEPWLGELLARYGKDETEDGTNLC